MNRNCSSCNNLIKEIKYFFNKNGNANKYKCRDCFHPECIKCSSAVGLITFGENTEQVTFCADCLQGLITDGFASIKMTYVLDGQKKMKIYKL